MSLTIKLCKYILKLLLVSPCITSCHDPASSACRLAFILEFRKPSPLHAIIVCLRLRRSQTLTGAYLSDLYTFFRGALREGAQHVQRAERDVHRARACLGGRRPWLQKQRDHRAAPVGQGCGAVGGQQSHSHHRYLGVFSPAVDLDLAGVHVPHAGFLMLFALNTACFAGPLDPEQIICKLHAMCMVELLVVRG